MIVGLDVLKGGFEISELEAGEDLTDALGITHYEPPAPPASMRGDQVSKKKTNKLFPVYPKMSHFKNYPDLFVEGEEVIVTEKIHGTNFRAGWAPMQIDSVWKKVKNFFGFLPKWEFVFGSHQVQLQGKKYNGFYSSNVYQQAVETYDLEAKIPLGIIIYGEIYGPGIQKGYGYGLAEGEHRLAIFDAIMSAGPAEELQGYVSWPMLVALAAEIGVPTVPVIYRGPYHAANVKDWESGHSQLCPTQAHREGVVIKPVSEVVCWIGRKILRSINPEYLLKSESDFH
jgi:RNA ligase (TIGR02306 family)